MSWEVWTYFPFLACVLQMEWRRETTEKEHVYALLSEAMTNWDTQKANSRAQLLKLQQKTDIDSQIQRDDIQRLENELSCLRLSNQMPDTFLENEDFWCNSAEWSSSGSTALNASREKNIRHWMCMMCLRNEVSIVFLPCTHQVLCSPCYVENFKTEGGFCPYCHVKIEESIKAYVPSSWIFPNWCQET